MTAVQKYTGEELGWQRKPGPPRVWRIVEGRRNPADGRTLRFSIQEIPKDRYEDVIRFMCTVFAREEALCACFGLIDDEEAIADFHKIWRFILEQGIVVGAFLVDDGNPRPPIVGTNMIMVNNDAVKRGMKQAVQFNSEPVKRIAQMMAHLDAEANVGKIYNVENYISAVGLCVHPEYRGQGLAYHLLRARDDMAVVYDIRATSTMFSSAAAQKAAANADFITFIDRKFVDLKNENGDELFPGVKAERCKLMGKSFSNVKNTTTTDE